MTISWNLTPSYILFIPEVLFENVLHSCSEIRQDATKNLFNLIFFYEFYNQYIYKQSEMLRNVVVEVARAELNKDTTSAQPKKDQQVQDPTVSGSDQGRITKGKFSTISKIIPASIKLLCFFIWETRFRNWIMTYLSQQ